MSNTDKEISRQLLHDLRMLAEKHLGNETYGKYLNYQHELQELLEKDRQSLLTEARKTVILRLSAWAVEADLTRGSNRKVTFDVDDWNKIREELKGDTA